jgi:hypothetical protein
VGVDGAGVTDDCGSLPLDGGLTAPPSGGGLTAPPGAREPVPPGSRPDSGDPLGLAVALGLTVAVGLGWLVAWCGVGVGVGVGWLAPPPPPEPPDDPDGVVLLHLPFLCRAIAASSAWRKSGFSESNCGSIVSSAFFNAFFECRQGEITPSLEKSL